MEYIENKKLYNNYVKHLKDVGLVNLDNTLDYWGFIPIDVIYLRCLYQIYADNNKFLDLGCGTGNVLNFAKNIGYDTYGVDFNNSLISNLSGHTCHNQDIRTLEDTFYSDFDVIYTYTPFKDGFSEYIDVVINNMKVGGYLLSPFFSVTNESVIKVNNFLYKKI
jgi:SAM-dependent methyltransferase